MKEVDYREKFLDAVATVLSDQEQAGLDILTNGDYHLDEDLGGIRATDALHATIWNSFNTKILETTDGGITWKPAQ